MLIEKSDPIVAWHFLPDDGRLQYGSRQLIKPGKTIHVAPPIELCRRGLHWSRESLQALGYAPGSIACRVEVWGETEEEDDKGCSEYRKVLWMADANETLKTFARLAALKVIHLWDAPTIVHEFLKTGDLTKANAAYAATYAAYAATYAAYAATYAANAATYAATYAANAATYAATYAANAATYAANAANAATYAAANASMRTELNDLLESMLMTLK